MSDDGPDRRDIEVRRGNTRRESHIFLDEDEAEIDISTYTFTFVVHKLGDPETIYVTLTSEFLSDTEVESFLSLANVETLLDVENTNGVFEHYATYETEAGDVETFDLGLYSVRG